MLTFSKTSWHYRLTDYAYGNDYTQWNLCKYFWGTIFAIVLVGWVVWVVRNWPDTNIKWPHIEWPQRPSKVPDPQIIFLILWTGGFGAWGIYTLIIGQFWAGLILVGIPTVAWSGILAAIAYDSWERDHPRKQKPYKAPKPKESNLMIEYLKAKKGKFCPVIIFIDEELR